MLITLSEASIRYGCSNDNFSVMYHYNNKLGKITPWMVIEDGKYFIDTNEYERQSEYLRRCWIANTEFLYWLMLEIFENDIKLSNHLAQWSDSFQSSSSWHMFLKVGMFAITRVLRVDLQPTMQTEFTKIAMRDIAIMIKEGRKLGKDFE